jgi:hypothetical protein
MDDKAGRIKVSSRSAGALSILRGGKRIGRLDEPEAQARDVLALARASGSDPNESDGASAKNAGAWGEKGRANLAQVRRNE